MKRLSILALLSVLLGACSGGADPATGTVPGAGGVKVETIITDANAVQAAAAPTVGKSDPGTATGLLGYVEGSQPTRLVVFCHGFGHVVEESWYGAVLNFIDADTAVVATNYRDNFSLPILRAAHDTIAATQLAKQRFPSVQTVYLLGVSLGGAVSGTAITEAAAIAADGRGLYDYWIAVEALSNTSEAWAEATGAAPAFAAFLEEESGGTPADVPDEYRRRSPALRTQEMADAGLKAAAVVHDVNDGLVVYNQAHETAKALAGVGIPTQLFTVLRVGGDQTPGTTGSGALAGIFGLDDPNTMIGLAGHGSEADYAHPVIRTGFEQLRAMLDGTYDATTPYMENVVDDGG